jgi:phage I-like protein
MAATQEQIGQQQRVIAAFQADVRHQLDLFANLQQRIDTYNRLGLSSDTVLDASAAQSLGTTVADYRAAVASIQGMLNLVPQGTFAASLEKVAR